MLHAPVCPQVLPNVANETLALETMPRRRLEYLKKVLPKLNSQSEDCLYLNIYVPSKCQSDFLIFSVCKKELLHALFFKDHKMSQL